MEMLPSLGSQYSVHVKGTDRKRRQYDGAEIVCERNFCPEKYDYVYETYGHLYGIHRRQIDEALLNDQHHFVICNDLSTIRALKRDYGKSVRVVFQYFDAPWEELVRIQKERDIGDDEVWLRLAKIEVLYRQFLEEWRLFDAILPNHYGEGRSALGRRMENLLSVFSAGHHSSVGILGPVGRFVKELESRLAATPFPRLVSVPSHRKAA